MKAGWLQANRRLVLMENALDVHLREWRSFGKTSIAPPVIKVSNTSYVRSGRNVRLTSSTGFAPL